MIVALFVDTLLIYKKSTEKVCGGHHMLIKEIALVTG